METLFVQDVQDPSVFTVLDHIQIHSVFVERILLQSINAFLIKAPILAENVN